jgi:MerR family transcriptional regulator/heat shock protein HspR
MTMMKRKKGFFSISAVAKMFSVHQQTIRLYEKEGLLTPKRSDGNTRLFSEEDVDRLEEIIYLTHQLGINLAGVEMIFKLKKQIHKMQKDMNKVFEDTQKELDQETESIKDIAAQSAKKLMKMRKNKDIEKVDQQQQLELVQLQNAESLPNDKVFDLGDWEVEYDE